MSWPAWVGLGLMAFGLLVALAGVARALPRAVRVRRQVVAFQRLLAQGGGAVIAELEELQVQREERAALLKPYRRWLKRARHPLLIALAQSYARRRGGRWEG